MGPRCVPSTGPAAPSLFCCQAPLRAALTLPDSEGKPGTRAHASSTFGCGSFGRRAFRQVGDLPTEWGVLMMQTVILEAACPAPQSSWSQTW